MLVIALNTPIFDHFNLTAPEGIGSIGPLWNLVVPAGLLIVAVALGFAVILTSAPWAAGALIGAGLIGAMHFVSYLGIGMLGHMFGVGSAIGIIGSGLILGGGFLARGRARPEVIGGPGPWVVLLGALITAVACFLPTGLVTLLKGTGPLVAPGGVPVQGWVIVFLQPLTFILIAAGIAGTALTSPAADRTLAGVLVGAGLIEALYFIALGNPSQLGTVPIGSVVGISGAVTVALGAALLVGERRRSAG